MEGSSTAGKRHERSSPSSGGPDPNPNDLFHYSSVAPAASSRRQPPSNPTAFAETVFRLLCPSEKTGCVIGKGGAVIRQIREETGARVRIEDPFPGCNDRVVIIMADAGPRRRWEGVVDSEEELFPAQRALVRVFERVARGEEGEGGEQKDVQGLAACRLLTPSGHVGSVLGKGGKRVEKIRLESGAQIRVLPKEQVPHCAVAGDELIQISGSFSAVKKALISVASCLQDNIRADSPTFLTIKPYLGSLPAPYPPVDAYPQRGYLPSPHGPDYHHRAYSSNPPLDNIISPRWKLPEEAVVFRMLCSNDKVGTIIGKFGVIIRSLQSETGAAIRIIDAASDFDDKIILIAALESYEWKHSPAQDAVLRVHSRLTEASIDKTLVSARLLVPAQQIGCLLGKGGSIITEMRRITGANIKIIRSEQLPKCAQPNDELVQVSGSCQSVIEALLQVTNRIRETFFPPKHYPNFGGSHYPHIVPEAPPPFRPKKDVPTPVRYPAVGFSHVPDPSLESPRDPSTSSQAMQSGNPITAAEGSATQAGIASSKTASVAVPKHYMEFVHGKSDDNIALIKEISGAEVTIYDPKVGAFEGTIVISGSQNQISTAKGLVHAFILNGL